MRFVPVKTLEAQAALALHRTRALLAKSRTMLVNALRRIWPSSATSRRRPRGTAELVALVEKRFAETGMPAVAQPRSPAWRRRSTSPRRRSTRWRRRSAPPRLQRGEPAARHHPCHRPDHRLGDRCQRARPDAVPLGPRVRRLWGWCRARIPPAAIPSSAPSPRGGPLLEGNDNRGDWRSAECRRKPLPRNRAVVVPKRPQLVLDNAKTGFTFAKKFHIIKLLVGDSGMRSESSKGLPPAGADRDRGTAEPAVSAGRAATFFTRPTKVHSIAAAASGRRRASGEATIRHSHEE